MFLKKRFSTLTLCFLLPFLIVLGYGVFRHVYPFGNQTVLTVDLGQQYIDFFALYRKTLLEHPLSFFYSFSKGLGGDMLGVFAYYLMSPFNLLLLFTPGKYLSVGVWLIILLKHGFIGLSMGYYLKKRFNLKAAYLPGLATAYALCGFIVANQFNLIWSDALIMLPLICSAIDTLISTKKSWSYPLILSLTLVINYYMGYMICLFIVLYFIWRLSQQSSIKMLKIWTFIWQSLLGAGLGAWLLLPTFFEITQSKGQYTVTNWHNKIEYNPLKIISKLIPGSFNFDQMPSGQPNLFVGTICLLLVFVYFITRHIPIKERLCAGFISLFLLLSVCYEPLDLIWHAGQFPVWYPYRFSFVICFWLIILSARLLESELTLTWYHLLPGFILAILGILYVHKHLKDYTALAPFQLELALVFLMISTLFLLFKQYQPKFTYFASIILIIELTTNLVLSLNQMSYLKQSEFSHYTQNIQSVAKSLPKSELPYRVGKTFMRTKNDPMQADFFGLTHFNSMLEPKYHQLMSAIGNPAGDGFGADTNQTILSDGLLGVKYYLAPYNQANQLPKSAFKSDLNQLSYQKHVNEVAVYQNPNALSFAYMSQKPQKHQKWLSNQPLSNQINWLNELTGNTDPLLFAENFMNTTFDNVRIKPKYNETFEQIDKSKAMKATYSFIPTTDDTYYLTLGSSANDHKISFKLNGQDIPIESSFRDTIVFSLVTNQKDNPQELEVTFKESNVWLQNFNLYRLDNQKVVTLLQDLQQQPLKVTKFKQNKIEGTITATANKPYLMTSIIAAKGWHLEVDGTKKPLTTAFKTFLAAELTPGKHHIKLYYWPPYLNLGLIISFMSLLLYLLYLFKLKTMRY